MVKVKVGTLPAALILAGLVWGRGAGASPPADGVETMALWLFDEGRAAWPSAVLNDASDHHQPLVLGPGGRLVDGKFGTALEIADRPEPVAIVQSLKADDEAAVKFGLVQLPTPPGRKTPPLSWMNARFAALMTSGEKHLRNEVGFANATDSRLNVGAFDWTIELWFRPSPTAGTRAAATRSDGVVFEIGEGPRGENDRVTRLTLDADRRGFTLVNQPGRVTLRIPSDPSALGGDASRDWHHLAFVYAAAEGQLRHYVDGVPQDAPRRARVQALAHGAEAYLTLGQDGRWARPLPGAIDELRVSTGQVYRAAFTPPQSFAPVLPTPTLVAGPPLLFDARGAAAPVVALGGRKHLFLDGALTARTEHVTFTVNPPRPAELVIPDIQGSFRKHVSVIEDEQGVVRLYNGVDEDFLEVHTAKDGVHFTKPALGETHHGRTNIAVPEPTAVGSVFIDPNAPADQRWRFVSGYHDSGIYVYSSPDGLRFRRHPTSVLPMRSGSQSNVFYDDQRQRYVGYHRSDCRAFPSGETRRSWVMTETTHLLAPWPFQPTTREDVDQAKQTDALRAPQPWFLDNGPLTPGGFCLEFPAVFEAEGGLDPVSTDMYVPKAIKYPWAPDTYLAFPTMYFHYQNEGPPTRLILGTPERGLGSGPIETQVAVSRDGVSWHRYPRPVYIGTGEHAGYNVAQAYIAHGMVRRGNEIWQYYFGTEEYHSSFRKVKTRSGVFRVVQRLDGFVSADTPYDTVGTLVTKPITFEGNRLLLNIDTDATGYAQVGFLDEQGRPIDGFGVDDGVYINGDFIEKEAEWLKRGVDVSALQGRRVQLVFRMRGAKLYAMQFGTR